MNQLLLLATLLCQSGRFEQFWSSFCVTTWSRRTLLRDILLCFLILLIWKRLNHVQWTHTIQSVWPFPWGIAHLDLDPSGKSYRGYRWPLLRHDRGRSLWESPAGSRDHCSIIYTRRIIVLKVLHVPLLIRTAEIENPGQDLFLVYSWCSWVFHLVHLFQTLRDSSWLMTELRWEIDH